jgi:hypothetical protein
MLTRKQVCELVGIDVRKLTSMVWRNQVPFIDESQISDELASRKDAVGWKRYSDSDALLLVLQDDLAREGGLDLSLASSIIASNAQKIFSNLNRIAGGNVTVWAGATFFVPEGRWHLCGTLSEIEKDIEDSRRRIVDREGDPEIARQEQASRLVLVNVNRALARLKERAAKANIILADPLWEPAK